MRVYNFEVCQQNLRNVGYNLAPDFSHYQKWLGESVSKWLVKNSSEFKDKFLSKVTVKTSTIMEGMPPRYYATVNGVETRLYFDDPFDKKDIEAGTLAYYTGIGLKHWLLKTYPVIVDARDFFLEKMRENPSFDLRRYTLDTLERSVRNWHVERERKLAAEARERLKAVRLDAQARSNLLTMLDVSRTLLEVPKERQTYLDEAWSLLKEGGDYRVLGEVNGHELLQYLSTSALEWESAYKLNCINGSNYKAMLSNPTSMLLSLREKENRARSFYTIECQYQERWSIVQFERWGYAHPLRNTAESDFVREALIRAVEEKLKTVKQPDSQPIREIRRGA